MKIAATVTFNTSRFRKIAKDELSQEEFMMASTSVVSLITNAQSRREDVRTFIREADPILALLVKHSASSPSRSLVSAFLAMVPLRHRQPVRARIEQMTRAEVKDKIKEAERRHVGEASIKLENFRRPTNHSVGGGENFSDTKQQQKVKKEAASNPEQLEAQREMEGGLMAAQQVRNAARERLAQKIKTQASGCAHDANSRESKSGVGSTSAKATPKNPYVVRNPYASRPSSSTSTGSTSKTPSISAAAPSANLPASGDTNTSAGTGTASSSASTFGSTRHVSKRARGMVQLKKKKQGTTEADTSVEAMDALDQCLHQVKTDVFTGDNRKSKSFLPKFKQTNVPEGLDCQICSETMKDPLVSDCNHSACTSCWTQWLKKNASCPACRTTMTRKNLSRIVFRIDDENDAAKLPTHSQVIRDAVAESDDEEDTGDSSDDGEEELELVAG